MSTSYRFTWMTLYMVRSIEKYIIWMLRSLWRHHFWSILVRDAPTRQLRETSHFSITLSIALHLCDIDCLCECSHKAFRLILLGTLVLHIFHSEIFWEIVLDPLSIRYAQRSCYKKFKKKIVFESFNHLISANVDSYYFYCAERETCVRKAHRKSYQSDRFSNMRKHIIPFSN